ncbi:glycerophosphodiester phosphodiesterase [Haloarcula litorea]|uniref:glycerophosphodiester phosphodiesterase n=1 Tax=Haloarcula litorea TaxID=3032579 RepID=UPI0023E894CB|nr:glycerophosphodiester phosphodiesterase [Halomicroarcula sp. GDY20]
MTAPSVVAHRGFAGQYPENTLAAMRGAAGAGADWVEVDVQPTADGDPVVFHDRRLDDGGESRGVTDGAGRVWDRSTAEVTSARVLDTDERVPTLAAVLDAIPGDVGVNVELKNPGTEAVRPGEALDGDAREAARERWQPFVDGVRAVVADHEHDVLFSSFCEGALAALDGNAGDAGVAVLVAPGSAEAGVAVARRYGVDALNVPVSALATDERATLTGAARDLDATRNVWTVRDWRDARRAVGWDADGIVADYPGLTAFV